MDRPVLPPRPDLLGHVGQERREQPQLDVAGRRPGSPWPRRCRAAVLGVRPLLDQLEVVVAELPEELLGDLERGGVVVGLERVGRARTTSPSRPSRAQSTGSVTCDGSRSVAPTPPRTNFEALSTFIASRRPTFIWVSSKGESRPGRAIAARQRTASAPYLSRIVGRDDDVALGLRHLLAVGVEDEAGDQRVRPRGGVVLEVRADHAGEEPGADDVVGLGAQVHREDPLPQVVVGLPAAGDLRGERRGRPGVHHVGVADEAARLAALVLGVARRARPSTGRSAARPRVGSSGWS